MPESQKIDQRVSQDRDEHAMKRRRVMSMLKATQGAAACRAPSRPRAWMRPQSI